MRCRPPGPDYGGSEAPAPAGDADPYQTEYSRQYGGRTSYAGEPAGGGSSSRSGSHRHGHHGHGRHQPRHNVRGRDGGRADPGGAGAAAAAPAPLGSLDDDDKRRAYWSAGARHPGGGGAAGGAAVGGGAGAAAAAAAPDGGQNSDDEIGGDGGAPRAPRDFADDATFVAALQREKGWQVRLMAEDGACLFRSVAFHLFGDADMHGTVRDQVMDYMVQNREHFSQYITEDFDEYIARKREDRCFGNHLEIQAICELYNRNVEVYSYSLNPINTFQADGNTLEPIRVSYHNNIHYNAIYDPERPAFGVGLGFAGLQTAGSMDQTQVEEAKAMSEQELIEKALLESSMQASMQETEDAQLQDAILQQVMLDSLFKS